MSPTAARAGLDPSMAEAAAATSLSEMESYAVATVAASRALPDSRTADVMAAASPTLPESRSKAASALARVFAFSITSGVRLAVRASVMEASRAPAPAVGALAYTPTISPATKEVTPASFPSRPKQCFRTFRIGAVPLASKARATWA
ncbi:unnamed protein product [Pseudo-nitzschia multistriata]|uniref:Uncharacterized protein n=1 Tax=Pseudo-nitzschia multistriata TaxID=183589 RepID=A0A448Z7D7_9STRA|nr:unnamed protein product [Pseudo-nitzschia multistriata]